MGGQVRVGRRASRRATRGGRVGPEGAVLGDGRAADVAAGRCDDDPANPLAAAPLWRLGESFDPALLESLGGPPFELAEAYQRAIDDGLRAAGFEVYQPQGTYFITTDITPFGEQDAYAFCRTLPERSGVVAVPNSVFYDDPEAGRSQVRFTFCKRDDVLHEATRRLQRLAS